MIESHVLGPKTGPERQAGYQTNIPPMDLGAPNNFGTEVTETLYHSTCHQTFAATNKNNYTSQINHNVLE